MQGFANISHRDVCLLSNTVELDYSRLVSAKQTCGNLVIQDNHQAWLGAVTYRRYQARKHAKAA